MLSHREQYDQDIKQKKTKQQQLKRYLVSQINFPKLNKDVEHHIFVHYLTPSWGNFDSLSDIIREGRREKELAEWFIEKALERLRGIECCDLWDKDSSNIVWSKLYELWPCLVKPHSSRIAMWGREWGEEVEKEIIEEYVAQKRDYSQRLLAFEKQVEIEEAKRAVEEEDFWAEFLDMEDIE